MKETNLKTQNNKIDNLKLIQKYKPIKHDLKINFAIHKINKELKKNYK